MGIVVHQPCRSLQDPVSTYPTCRSLTQNWRQKSTLAQYPSTPEQIRSLFHISPTLKTTLWVCNYTQTKVPSNMHIETPLFLEDTHRTIMLAPRLGCDPGRSKRCLRNRSRKLPEGLCLLRVPPMCKLTTGKPPRHLSFFLRVAPIR